MSIGLPSGARAWITVTEGVATAGAPASLRRHEAAPTTAIAHTTTAERKNVSIDTVAWMIAELLHVLQSVRVRSLPHMAAEALGLVETKGLIGSIEAADAMVKAA